MDLQQTKQSGFTLIEILVVLSVISIVLLISIPISTSFIERKNEETVLHILEYDLLYLQNQTLGSSYYNRIVLYEDRYVIETSDNKDIIRNLPTGWRINRRQYRSIAFNEYGTIRQAGTIQLISPKNKYNIVFPPGKGRGYIEKQ
ncbi:competence type IV pilus minor pilin ComGD [Ornithinibacillus halotolerans]|uniref:Prepilin-type N-terminal cleavage/methylation domain-containing protein n=1 Tax=Ornithinibacillus halotolerans TaxID=1274357 RepID=A0A916RUL2_9BACI|nr:competence type IV pilus minor pilin ComGD [Ornithinibacillus halotolerans]GGA68310.1 hypothetical protein GCM10008025_10360 [Ornithinibacillus halotolerans]